MDLDKEMTAVFRKNLEPDQNLVKKCKSEAENGNRDAMLWLARMYRDGRGTEKDLGNAAEWYRRITEKNADLANEFADVLFEIGTPESYEEMVSVIIGHSRSGNAGATRRMGTAYRQGKGVEKDLDAAIMYQRVATCEGQKEAAGELVLALLERRTEEDVEEAFVMASCYRDYDDPDLAVHLSHMYRHGIGIEKDIDAAIEHMTFALERGHDAAKKELAELLSERDGNTGN